MPFFLRILAILLIGILLPDGRSVSAQDTTQELDPGRSGNMLMMVNHYYENDLPDSLRLTFTQFFKEVSLHPRKYPVDHWVDICYSLSVSIFRNRDYDLLIGILDPLINLEPFIIDNNNHGSYGRLMSLLAITYKNEGYLAESIPIYMMALKHLKECESLPERTLPEFYSNLGIALWELGDLGEADIYLAESLRGFNLLLENPQLEPADRAFLLRRKALVLNNYGLNYQSYGNHEKAITLFQESLEISRNYEEARIPRILSNLGVSYREKGDNQNAFLYSKDAIEWYEKLEFPKDQTWAVYKLNLADLFIDMEDDSLENAEKIIANVLRASQRFQGSVNSVLSRANYMQGSILTKRKLYEDAIKSFDKGLNMLMSRDNSTEELKRVPEISLDNSPDKILDGIMFRARTYADWGKAATDTGKLIISLENYHLSELCIDTLRMVFEGEESKINLSRLAKETYAEKLDLIWTIYSEFPTDGLLSQAFESIERGKAGSLWNIIQVTENKKSNLPEKIIKEEKTLKREIAEYQNKIINIDNSNPESIVELESLKDHKFKLESRLDSLINYIKTEYGGEEDKHFIHELLSLQDARKELKKDQAIIQYYFGDKHLHQIYVGKRETKYIAHSFPDSIRRMTEDFHSRLNLKTYDYSSQDVIDYHRSAWNLYEVLVDPFSNLIEGKKLIIMPDEYLSLIPFETLVTSEMLIPDSDFGDMKYLILKNQINYSYNASLWALERTRSFNPKRDVLAFAPKYDVKGIDTSHIWRDWVHFLPELPGTHEEVKRIEKKYRTLALQNRKATEKKFKDKAGDYRILHLAMHSHFDNINPESLCLVFTPFADKKDDGKLYTNEIRNLELNADLTILSACNSGTGELARGEGVMSLSRMFLLAGSSSVIMTLWPVDDQVSQELINRFYDDLSFDMSISEALRSSKINYFAEMDNLYSHPYFWSGFIQLGKDPAIKIRNNIRGMPVFIILGILAILTVIFLLARNTKSRLWD